MKLSERKHIIFCHEHYNPIGLIRSLGEYGFRPYVIIVKSYPIIASKSKYIKKLHKVDSIENGYQLLLDLYGNKNAKKPFLYTSDDKIMSYLDYHYDELVNKFFFFNAGEKGRITYFMDKYNVSSLAKDCGFKVPDLQIVKKGEIPNDLEYPIITKAISPNSGAWKEDVFICNSKEELKKAYKKIKGNIIILQKYIEKINELCLEGLATKHGKNVFIGIGTNYKYLVPGAYSPWMNVFNFTNKQLLSQIEKIISIIKYEGVFDIEFIIDKDHNYYFMEINFRNSAWSYASTCAGMNLPLIWSKSMVSQKDPSQYLKKVPKGFNAMVETTDFKYRVLSKQVSLLQWIKELRQANCLFLYNRSDAIPLIWWIFTKIAIKFRSKNKRN